MDDEVSRRRYGPRFYIPDPVTHELREVGTLEWGHWMETIDNRVVAWTGNEARHVSTICIGLDHRFFGDGPPLVFETMIFIDGEGIEGERYGSWAAAEAGHKRFVDKFLMNAKAHE